MASTLPPVQAFVKSNASLVKLLAPPPFFLLFLLLFLSLLLALSLLHINDLLTHSLSRPRPLFHFLSPLLFDKQVLLSHLLHIQQHYLGFLLSPCSIFILANFIVFTLFLSVYFSSSASPSSDFSDLAPEKFEDHDASLPEHELPSHGDFFLASPPHLRFVLSQDPPEEYHVLSFDINYDESTYYRNVQSYCKLSNNWEKVEEISLNPNITSSIINGVDVQREAKTPQKVMAVEKAQSAPTIAVTPADKVLNVDQGKVVEKGLQENRLQEKEASRSTKLAAAYSLPGRQAVVINMEPPAPASRRNRTLTNASMQASHPPLALVRHPSKATPPLPPNPSNLSAQRLPSSPRVKKSMQNGASSGNDGRYEASKPTKPQKKPSSMVRSHSDQRLSQRDPSTEGTSALTNPSSSFSSRPQMQRAQSLRSSINPNTITDVSTSSSSLTKKPNAPTMRRAQSLRASSAPDGLGSPYHGQVARSPPFSASLDGLSDGEANKRFSDFIAHRFALMKKELDFYST